MCIKCFRYLLPVEHNFQTGAVTHHIRHLVDFLTINIQIWEEHNITHSTINIFNEKTERMKLVNSLESWNCISVQTFPSLQTVDHVLSCVSQKTSHTVYNSHRFTLQNKSIWLSTRYHSMVVQNEHILPCLFRNSAFKCFDLNFSGANWTLLTLRKPADLDSIEYPVWLECR